MAAAAEEALVAVATAEVGTDEAATVKAKVRLEGEVVPAVHCWATLVVQKATVTGLVVAQAANSIRRNVYNDLEISMRHIACWGSVLTGLVAMLKGASMARLDCMLLSGK